MSLPTLTKSRLKVLKAAHGWQLVATWPKAALRLLARTDVAIEKLTNTPRWRAGRIALQQFRIGRGPKTTKQRIPNNGYRSAKVGHWLKDHSRRIKDMAEDAVCAAATGFGAYQSPAEAIAAFNDHITPIAKLYGFKLHVDGDGILRGDISKATSVLTYLCSSQRTREIDWLLDMVTVMTQDQPFQWEGAWKRKLRHTKRGAWWRARRERREQQEAIAVTKERQRELDRAALNETIQDGGVYSNAPHSHIAATPTMAEQEGDVAGDLKRLLGHEQYYPWRWGGKRNRRHNHE